MNEMLKPCPFCGGKVGYAHDIEMIPYGVTCMRCHMVVRFTRIEAKKREPFGIVMDKIANAWNQREYGRP